jgi:hypothetical protein
MLIAGHSRSSANDKAKARHHREARERFHYDDGFNAARGIITAMLLGIGLWWMIWAFFFG